MPTIITFLSRIAGTLLTGMLVANLASADAEPTVIELTQVPCQILEAEGGVNRGFESVQAADCESINSTTGEARIAAHEPMQLKAGRYIFRVTNRNVPYDLGFWLRGAGVIGRATLPSVSGGGLSTGSSRDYLIDLKPGDYQFSCPLNPTPDYPLRVR